MMSMVRSQIFVFGSLLAAALSAQSAVVSDRANPCLNLREGPSYRAGIIECLEVGTPVTIQQAQGGWSRVVVGNELEGWVGGKLLDVQPGAPSTSEATSEEAAPEPQIELRRAPEPAPEAAVEPPVQTTTPADDPSEDRRPKRLLLEARQRIKDLELELTNLALSHGANVPNAVEGTDGNSEGAVLELQVAEERIASLESRLALAEAQSAQTNSNFSDVTSRVQELTTEKDRLTRQLAQAEARQLYLQADLEKTRSELMTLKGIPAKLVQIEPEPVQEPIPTPVEPEAAPPEPEVAVPVAEEFPLPIDPGSFAADDVVQMLRAWARSWSNQRPDDYLSFYSDSFLPDSGESREEWTRNRRARIVAPRSIEVTVSDLAPILSEDRAVVTFEQSYVSDNFSDVVRKVMVLERQQGVWLIAEERAE